LRGVSKIDHSMADPSRLAEDGEHLRMTEAVRPAEPGALRSIVAAVKHLDAC
jgi:hypothetical protein